MRHVEDRTCKSGIGYFLLNSNFGRWGRRPCIVAKINALHVPTPEVRRKPK
ncbi:hypothetical protein Csa_021769 [Cucumis sativus]|uniref:Uncharacterized protein n=1 Tax=Cucumis sativus TaxID=3659 RepID=A0A0A0KF62_CUCSA|nr:hypothetical protein Csa_021769 [Cucumis sativus]